MIAYSFQSSTILMFHSYPVVGFSSSHISSHVRVFWEYWGAIQLDKGHFSRRIAQIWSLSWTSIHKTPPSVDRFRTSRINGSFVQTSLDNNPDFRAISYCWGSSDLVDKVWFNDHQYLGITRSAAAVIRFLIGAKYTGHFWIDAVCIYFDRY